MAPIDASSRWERAFSTGRLSQARSGTSLRNCPSPSSSPCVSVAPAAPILFEPKLHCLFR
jgi:hypothetical protein